MLLRLWEAEQPRAVLVGWDSLGVADLPERGLPGLPERARVRRRAARAARPAARARRLARVRRREGAGYEADDFLAAAVAAEEERGGTTLVATSDRDALPAREPSDDDPPAGPRRVARSRASARRRCASATASSRSRCRTSSPSAAIPPTSSRARAGIGPKKAAEILQEYATLEDALGRGPVRGGGGGSAALPRIATLDASAPLPPLVDQTPTWERRRLLRASSG